MKMLANRGFTIIEVMLFLAISGVLAAALLGGWTVMINTQRYKDSVDTVYGYIQDQYNLVYNVENERSSSLVCTSSGVQSGVGGGSRGQSDCLLMGRYIKLTKGTTFRSYAVVGREPSSEVTGTDSEQIKQYNPTVVGQSIGLSEVEQIVPWGAVLKRPGANMPALNTTILLLRSPTTGIVHRYIIDGERIEPVIGSGDINAANESNNSIFCFDPGTVVQGGGQAVMIGKYASSRNSVETWDRSKSGC